MPPDSNSTTHDGGELEPLAFNARPWDQGQLTLRIESSLSKVSALAIAASVN